MLYIPIIIAVIVVVIWFKQYENSFFKKPLNYPEIAKINSANKPVFIAFGDSLTQANMSADWLSIVETKNPNLQCFNAGMNADLTDTLLTRIDEIIECQPQIISILVGSNDVMATTSPARMKRYYDLKKITQDVDFETFKANYFKIITQLKAETTAKIILVSIPPITEDWEYVVNVEANKYANFIKDLAEKEGLNYVPFRETLRANMPVKSDQIVDYPQSVALLRMAGFKKNFLGKTWNEISASRKAKYLTDNIHLNEDASEILADLMIKELKNIEIK